MAKPPAAAQPHLILASGSPRRRELLAGLGLEFTVERGADIDEGAFLAAQSGSPASRLKALAAAKGASVAQASPDAVILSADTEVILDGEFLGKPVDAAAAVAMLRLLSGRRHTVCTAIAVQQAGKGRLETEAVVTTVTFHELSARQIENYVGAAQPFDFAGGYAMQGLGSLLIAHIEGDTSNVIGLPLGATIGLLCKFGIDPLGLRDQPAA